MKDSFKKIGLVLLCVFGISNAKAETILTNIYEIVSDEYSDNVKEGTCLVQGKVYEGHGEIPVTVGYIGEVSQKRHTKVKKDGTFSLKLSDQDSILYFYHPTYGEIVVSNYDFKSQHIVTINFITGSNLPPGMEIMEEKPVIYLYSDKSMEVALRLKPKGDFTFTYPVYDDGWKVQLIKNEGIEVNGKPYPYLFWEASTNDLEFLVEDEMEGYYIKTDSCVGFLEGVLSELGLNAIEQTDFITYWGPRLQAHKYATVQFLVDDQYDERIAELAITPTPAASRRVYMLFKGSQKAQALNFLSKPSYPAFERKGFVLVEWGGSEFLER